MPGSGCQPAARRRRTHAARVATAVRDSEACGAMPSNPWKPPGGPAREGWSLRVDSSELVAGRRHGFPRSGPRTLIHAQRGTQIRQGGLLDQRDALGTLVGGPRVVITLDA